MSPWLTLALGAAAGLFAPHLLMWVIRQISRPVTPEDRGDTATGDERVR